MVPPRAYSGFVGNSFQFDGVDDRIDVGGGATIAGPRTVETWVFPNVNTGLGLPILTGGVTDVGDFFGIAGTANGFGQHRLYIDHWNSPGYVSTVAVTPNQWNHVAFSYDETKVTFYVNGIAAGSVIGSLYDYEIDTYTIGGNTIGGTTTKESFSGQLDEVSLYRRALSAAEINRIFAAGPAGKEIGALFDAAEPLDLRGPSVVPGLALSNPNGAGLVGSYVNGSRRNDDVLDWRSTFTIAGTRIDSSVDFRTNSWGVRGDVGVVFGSDSNWDDFSVQWDGEITIPVDGTYLYTRSDDGSRMWIDVNGDGNFQSNSSEFLNNNWGQGQSTTTSDPSLPLNAGTYKVRIQYEEGGGDNTMQLLWSFAPPQSGRVMFSGVGQQHVFRVDFDELTFYRLRLDDSSGNLANGAHRMTLFNEFGQHLLTTTDGMFKVQGPARPGIHYLVVEAIAANGLGEFELKGQAFGQLNKQRDVPLYYFDFTGATTHYGENVAQPFPNRQQIPFIIGSAQAQYGGYGIDVTESLPDNGREHISFGLGLFPDVCCGLGYGSFGTRSRTGSSLFDDDGSTWTKLADSWEAMAIVNHEIGHQSPHIRHPLDFMGISYRSVGDVAAIGMVFAGTGNLLESEIGVYRHRNVDDLAHQSGRMVIESDDSGSLAKAQDLDVLLAEMTTDNDVRNNRVTVFGEISERSDADYFRFTASAGQEISFDIDATEFQEYADTTLVILDRSGNEIARNEAARDRESGIDSADPYLVHQFATAGTYYVKVTSVGDTTGRYRFKWTPEEAYHSAGPRVIAAWPNGGDTSPTTRQLTLWFNGQIDPQTIADNIEVRGGVTGVRSGSAVFDPLDASLIWTADAPAFSGYLHGHAPRRGNGHQGLSRQFA